MKTSQTRFVGTVSILAVLALTVVTGQAAWRIKQSAALARQSEPLQALPDAPLKSLLIVGDSTGVGTGASSPAHSVAGLIARDHPQWRIVNRSEDGARFADIALQLQGDERFDAVLVMGGGNDVIRLTRHDALAQSIATTVQLAKGKSNLVLIQPPGNVGNAPFFFPPLSWLMTRRSKSLHRLVREVAAEYGAVYINLYQDRADDPFAQQPDEFNARDGLHPSDTGYRLWYDALITQGALSHPLGNVAR